MMSLKFLILITLISCSLSGSKKEVSSSDCQEVQVKGYLVQKVRRDEMEDIQRNKRLKEQGKSYGQAIDYYEEIFFIPLDSLSETRGMSKLLTENVNFYNKQVFFFPSDETKLYVEKLCGREVAMSEFKNSFNYSSPYFANANDPENKYLYRLKYLEAQAVHSKVENTSYNQRYFRLRYRIDKALDFFDAYFVYTITENVQRVPLEESIKAWIMEN